MQNIKAARQATAKAASDHTTDEDIVDGLLVAAIAMEHSNGFFSRCMEHSNGGGSSSSRDQLADKQPVHERFGLAVLKSLLNPEGIFWMLQISRVRMADTLHECFRRAARGC